MHCYYNSNYKYNQINEIMREIRYRGIGIAERKWVFGSLWFDTRNKATLIWSEELKYWVRVDIGFISLEKKSLATSTTTPNS